MVIKLDFQVLFCHVYSATTPKIAVRPHNEISHWGPIHWTIMVLGVNCQACKIYLLHDGNLDHTI